MRGKEREEDDTFYDFFWFGFVSFLYTSMGSFFLRGLTTRVSGALREK